MAKLAEDKKELKEPCLPKVEPMNEHIPSTDKELKRLVRTYLLRTLVSLFILTALVALLMFFYGNQVTTFTQWVLDTIGLGGIVLLIFITDSVVSPFPPDSVLLLLSQSALKPDWFWVVPLIGTVSTTAGMTGYAGGRLLANGKWGNTLFGKFRETRGPLIKRYGFWAVTLGALTPLPFSITCWSSGLLKVPFRKVWPATLLRIPRYVAYYWVISAAPQILNLMK